MVKTRQGRVNGLELAILNNFVGLQPVEVVSSSPGTWPWDG